uniref:MIF4G domain-containing protein n=1 Tax=Ditylenchus dipsaci TaxID=166011 RepID=A0A915EUB9_9BILA
MANIQATLLNGSSKPRNDKPRRAKQPIKAELSFDSITEAMDRIKLADTDLTASLSDVRPYLLQNTASFSEDELEKLCSVFCASAIQQTNAYYIVGLCTDLIGIARFGEQMSDQLRQLTIKFLSDSTEEVEKCKSLPDFLAQLAMARWHVDTPRLLKTPI